MIVDLTQNKKMVIDDEDWELVEDLTVYAGINGYAYFTVWHDGKSESMTLHSLLCQAPPGMHVDHINGDKLDNRRSNLRSVSYQLNQVNRKKLNRNNTSGVRGVCFYSKYKKKPWVAQITVNRKNVRLGQYATKEEAAEARREAELKYYGEYCP